MGNRTIIKSDSRGFSLVELLVAITISGLVLGSIYSIYLTQNKTFGVQQEVVTLQQNLRGVSYLLERELRMAGYNPTATDAGSDTIDNDCDGDADGADPDFPAEPEVIGLHAANSTTLTFSKDDNTDGAGDSDICDTDELIAYALNGTDLEKNGSVIAENIQVLNFVYLNGANPPAPLTSLPLSKNDRALVRSVQVTLIALTARADKDYTDTGTYKNLQGDDLLVSPGDGFRRRALSFEVNLRNLEQ